MCAQKGTKKPPGESPGPPVSPSGRYSLFCLFALCCSWIDSTRVPALRLPPAGPSFGVPPNDWPGDASAACLPTGSNVLPAVAHRCIASLLRSDSERSPAAGSPPLRGRQAELVESQTPRSEPRRTLLFTGHRSSSFAERVRKSPAEVGRPVGTAPSKGVQKRRFWRAFGYFSRV